MPQNMINPGGKKSLKDQLQRRQHFNSKRMQDFLKEENFSDAGLALLQIIRSKRPDWNEISFIWCHAITKQDLNVANAIIDLLTTRKVVRKEAIGSPELDTTPGQKTDQRIEEEKVPESGQVAHSHGEPLPPLTILSGADLERAKCDEKLAKKYGFSRQTPLIENPFETIDNLNFDMNEADIGKLPEIHSIAHSSPR
jgi:hypothetical protein